MTTELPRCRYTRRAPIGPLPSWLPIWRWPYLFQYVGTKRADQTTGRADADRVRGSRVSLSEHALGRRKLSVGYLSAVALRLAWGLCGVWATQAMQNALQGVWHVRLAGWRTKSACADVCVLCAGRNPTEMESS